MPQKRTTKAGTVRWVARWRDPSGKSRSKSFGTRREAKAHEDEMSLGRHTGTYYDPREHRATVGELFDRWLYDRDLRPSTVTRYRNTRDVQLVPLADYPAADVTPRDVHEWYTSLRQGRKWIAADDRGIAERSARFALGHLRAAMKWGVETGAILRNPVRVPSSTTVDEPAKIPTLAEILRVVARLRDGGAVYEDRQAGKTRRQSEKPAIADMATVAVMTGLRVAEVAGLVADDVDLVHGVIRVRYQLAQRGGIRRVELKTKASRRNVPIPAELRPLMVERVDGAGAGGWLFTSSSGNPINPGTIATHVRRAALHEGCERVHFHALRHFYASSLLTVGVPLQDVAATLGHAKPTTTLRIYAHVLEGARDRVAEAVSSAIGRGIAGGSPGLRAVGD